MKRRLALWLLPLSLSLAPLSCALPDLTLGTSGDHASTAPDGDDDDGDGSTPDGSSDGTGGGQSPEQICTADEPSCADDSHVRTCNGDGTAYLAETSECQANQYCLEGACTAYPCGADELFCKGKEIHKCAEDRRSSVVQGTCSEDEYCDAASASCQPGVCAPDKPVCDGNTASTCNGAGSGYLAGGEDCGSGGTCAQGECHPHLCTPSSKSCSGNSVVTCAADGLSSTTAGCGGGTNCQSGNCVSNVCTPNAVDCSGNTRRVCNSTGSAFASQAACTNQACVNGVCTGCNPGSFSCSGKQPQQCNSSGQWVNSGSACTYICSGSGTCSGNCATPGARQCSGSTHQTCGADYYWSNTTDSPGAAGCSNRYYDSDNDTYGTSSYACYCAANGNYRATRSGDCCDADASARPNQTGYFASTNACGSWDYDCSGAISTYRSVSTCADNCSHRTGWDTLYGCPRNCGEPGHFIYAFDSFCGVTGWANEYQSCK